MTVEALKCPICAAPVTMGLAKCDYCGTPLTFTGEEPAIERVEPPWSPPEPEPPEPGTELPDNLQRPEVEVKGVNPIWWLVLISSVIGVGWGAARLNPVIILLSIFTLFWSVVALSE